MTDDLRAEFLQGMSLVASTVNVVTTDGSAGRFGVTVSAMTSVSADTPKPTLLVCVNQSSSGAAPILENGNFCVNILHEAQSEISDIFAGRSGPPAQRFETGSWIKGPTGAPILEGALVSFDCRLETSKLMGTHHIFIGSVEHVAFGCTGKPLIYAQRAYGRPMHLAGDGA